MKPGNDLPDLLQCWNPPCVPDAGFNRGVWSRIEAAESRRNTGLADLVAWVRLLARPRVAVTAAMVALFGGSLLGSLQARTGQEARYLHSLNPYAQPSRSR